MKVWIVWYAPYNEHGPYLDRAFSTKEKAEQYLQSIPESTKNMSIEEVPLDQDN